MTPHENKVNQALAKLPRDVFDIADFLLASGVRGRRNSACDCPIAHFIASQLPGATVTVSEVVVSVRFPNTPLSVVVPTPFRVSDFIQHFDARRFPRLDSSVLVPGGCRL